MRARISSAHLFWGFFLATPLFLHWPVLRAAWIHPVDDGLLLGPLQELSGLADYWRGIRDGRIFDLQPLRDLTYFFDILISRTIGHSTFHATNLCLWYGISLYAHRIFASVVTRRHAAELLTGAWLVHPVFVGSVAWISNRKHLLSALFIFAVSAYVLRHRERARATWVNLLFLASVLAQPLNLLWPVWWAAFSRWELGQRRREIASRVLPSIAILAITALANQWYYAGPYLTAYLGAALGPSLTLTETFLHIVLTLGRSLLQIIFPWQVSVLDYLPGDPWNYVGVAALPLALYGAAKAMPRRTLALWSLPFFLPLLTTTIRPTWSFVCDRYLIWPSLGIFVLAGMAAAKLIPHRGPRRQGWLFAAAIVFILMLGKSHALAQLWTGGERYWEEAHRAAPTPRSLHHYGESLLRAGKFREAAELGLDHRNRPPHGQHLFAEAIFRDPSLPPARKEPALARFAVPTLAYSYRLAVVRAQLGQFREAYDTLLPALPALGRDPHAATVFGRENHGTMAADLMIFCARSDKADCAALERQIRAQLAHDSFALQSFERALGPAR